jgi:hypothetical protein
MDNKKVLLLVLLDNSAAFDTVSHDILLSHLQQCGIVGDAHSLMVNYLSDRKQMIFINNKKSLVKPVSCGVPQGSVLGPLLFCVYLTGLKDVMTPFGIHYMWYADDIQLFMESSVDNLSGAVMRMEQCIGSVKEWFTSILLSLNGFY